MVGIILILVIFGGLAIVFRFLSKACSSAGQYLQEHTQESEYNKRVLHQSLSNIEQSVVKEVEAEKSLTQVLQEASTANKEKKKLTRAMSEELGITN